MGLVNAQESVPLQATEDGVVRVVGARVTLDAVEAYLAERRNRSREVRQQNASRFDAAGVRARLLARRSE